MSIMSSDISCASSYSYEPTEAPDYDFVSESESDNEESSFVFESATQDDAADSGEVIVEFENGISPNCNSPVLYPTNVYNTNDDDCAFSSSWTRALETTNGFDNNHDEYTLTSWTHAGRSIHTTTGDNATAISVGSNITGFDILSTNGGSCLLKCSQCGFLNLQTSKFCRTCPAALIANPCTEHDEQIALNLQQKEEAAYYTDLRTKEDEQIAFDLQITDEISGKNNEEYFRSLQVVEDEKLAKEKNEEELARLTKESTQSCIALDSIQGFTSNMHSIISALWYNKGLQPLPVASLYAHGSAFKKYVTASNLNQADSSNVKLMFYFSSKFCNSYEDICQNGLPVGSRVSNDAEVALYIQTSSPNNKLHTISENSDCNDDDELCKRSLGWIVATVLEKNAANCTILANNEEEDAVICTSCVSDQFLPLVSFDASIRHHKVIQSLLSEISQLCSTCFLETSDNEAEEQPGSEGSAGNDLSATKSQQPPDKSADVNNDKAAADSNDSCLLDQDIDEFDEDASFLETSNDKAEESSCSECSGNDLLKTKRHQQPSEETAHIHGKAVEDDSNDSRLLDRDDEEFDEDACFLETSDDEAEETSCSECSGNDLLKTKRHQQPPEEIADVHDGVEADEEFDKDACFLETGNEAEESDLSETKRHQQPQPEESAEILDDEESTEILDDEAEADNKPNSCSLDWDIEEFDEDAFGVSKESKSQSPISAQKEGDGRSTPS